MAGGQAGGAGAGVGSGAGGGAHAGGGTPSSQAAMRWGAGGGALTRGVGRGVGTQWKRTHTGHWGRMGQRCGAGSGARAGGGMASSQAETLRAGRTRTARWEGVQAAPGGWGRGAIARSQGRPR